MDEHESIAMDVTIENVAILREQLAEKEAEIASLKRGIAIEAQEKLEALAEARELRAQLAALEQQEPVAKVIAGSLGPRMAFIANGKDSPKAGTKLYASPVPAAEQKVPDGWKMVPIEPTDEMADKARNAPMPLVLLDSRRAHDLMMFRNSWKAALAAAPSFEKEEAQ